MKRFITYLYECESGSKTKNVGFIRVNVRNEETIMEVYIKNFSRSNDVGKIYAFTYKENLVGIELGGSKISNGQSEARVVLKTENIMGYGASINDIVGIGIRLQSGGYLVSCWKDEHADEMISGEFRLKEECINGEESSIEEFVTESSLEKNTDIEMSLEVAEEIQLQNQENGFESYITYEKIDLNKIRNLPSPNWHLTTNSFLVHGFANFGYLVLKKEMEEGKEKLSLGVPGVFEKPEAVMAILFGLPTFEEIPEEMVVAEMNHPMSFQLKEKNQEAKVGAFGGWFVTLQD